MSKKSDDDTATILKKLGILIPLFYVILFILAAILSAAYDFDFDANLPFEYDKIDPTGNDYEIAAWLNLFLGYMMLILLVFFIVKSTRKSWDYVTTVTIIHFGISCAVIQESPENWIYWLTIVLLTIFVSTVSELATYFLRDLKDIDTGRD
eukprot:GFYU01002815.1.p1 GENE.GFYU01002815.1~~GFYU01002815.1.p1  ORF type:complete len:151 (+),score=39.88 GFYU01002815.1:128-580(+)